MVVNECTQIWSKKTTHLTQTHGPHHINDVCYATACCVYVASCDIHINCIECDVCVCVWPLFSHPNWHFLHSYMIYVSIDWKKKSNFESIWLSCVASQARCLCSVCFGCRCCFLLLCVFIVWLRGVVAALQVNAIPWIEVNAIEQCEDASNTIEQFVDNLFIHCQSTYTIHYWNRNVPYKYLVNWILHALNWCSLRKILYETQSYIRAWIMKTKRIFHSNELILFEITNFATLFFTIFILIALDSKQSNGNNNAGNNTIFQSDRITMMIMMIINDDDMAYMYRKRFNDFRIFHILNGRNGE